VQFLLSEKLKEEEKRSLFNTFTLVGTDKVESGVNFA